MRRMILTLCLLTSPAFAADAERLNELFTSLENADETSWEQIENKIWSEWSESGSPAMDLLLQRGADALEEGDYALAIDHLTALTDHAPGFAEGWHLRAQAYYRRSLYGPALADLERAVGKALE